MRWNPALNAISIVLIALISTFVAAENSEDRVHVGRSIIVQPGEKAGDLVCVACSIRVRGQTTGDVVVVAGNVTVESGGKIAGDVAAVAGHVRKTGRKSAVMLLRLGAGFIAIRELSSAAMSQREAEGDGCC